MLALLCLAISSFLAVQAAPSAQAPPSFIYAGDAPWSNSSSVYANALNCSEGLPTAERPPVLLVHGTFISGVEAWQKGYVPALKAQNYTPCYIDIPNLAMGDMQWNAEFIAYNIHYMTYLAGGVKTSVITHSQGGTDTQWALEFWPSVRDVTESWVALAPDFVGLHNYNCTGHVIRCVPALWQQMNSSHYYDALHNDDFHSQVPTTTVWSSNDGTVAPYELNAQLPGATILEIQNLCPNKSVIHLNIVYDSAAFAFALDALQHGGYADLGRLVPQTSNICGRAYAPNMNPTIVADIELLGSIAYKGFIIPKFGTTPTSEPPVKAYALAKEVASKRAVSRGRRRGKR